METEISFLPKNMKKNLLMIDGKLERILRQGKDQVILGEDKSHKIQEEDNSNRIMPEYDVYANLKNENEHNIKLFNIKYDKDNNKTITYYRFGTGEILAELMVGRKTDEINFDFDVGLYDDPYFQDYVEEILNADYKSFDSFNYELSYLAHAPAQLQQFRNCNREKYVYIANVEDDDNEARIVDRSLKEKDKTFISGISVGNYFLNEVPGHAVQAIINNGTIVVLNTGGSEEEIYEFFFGTVEKVCLLNLDNKDLDNKEIKKLYNFIKKIKNKSYSINKKYKKIIEYIKNNKNCPIKVLHTRNIDQAFGNCVLASKLDMMSMTMKYYERYRQFYSLAGELNDLEMFFRKIERKKIKRQKINYINSIDQEKYERMVALIGIIAEANAELLKNTKQFDTVDERLSKLIRIFMEAKSKINVTKEDRKIRHIINKGIKKNEKKLLENEVIPKSYFIHNFDYFPDTADTLDFVDGDNNFSFEMKVLLAHIKCGEIESVYDYINELNIFAAAKEFSGYEGGKNQFIIDNLNKVIEDNFKEPKKQGDLYAKEIVSIFSKIIDSAREEIIKNNVSSSDGTDAEYDIEDSVNPYIDSKTEHHNRDKNYSQYSDNEYSNEENVRLTRLSKMLNSAKDEVSSSCSKDYTSSFFEQSSDDEYSLVMV